MAQISNLDNNLFIALKVYCAKTGFKINHVINKALESHLINLGELVLSEDGLTKLPNCDISLFVETEKRKPGRPKRKKLEESSYIPEEETFSIMDEDTRLALQDEDDDDFIDPVVTQKAEEYAKVLKDEQEERIW